jgi:hypothetical protein
MNATNIVEQLLFQTGATVRDSMTRNLQLVEESARRTGRETMVHVNHPNYKWGITAEDLAAVVNERFFEVWNGVDGDNDPGDQTRPSTDVIWDVANTLRIVKYKAAPLYGLATDDSHNYHGNKTHSPPGRAWVMVRARHLTPESIVRAIKKGDFYATTGVELADVAFADKTLRLKIAARPGETYVTRFIGPRKGVRLNPEDARNLGTVQIEAGSFLAITDPETDEVDAAEFVGIKVPLASSGLGIEVFVDGEGGFADECEAARAGVAGRRSRAGILPEGMQGSDHENARGQQSCEREAAAAASDRIADAEGIAESMRQLLLDEDQRRRFGEAARQSAACFSWDNTVSAYDSLYKNLVRNVRERSGCNP